MGRLEIGGTQHTHTRAPPYAHIILRTMTSVADGCTAQHRLAAPTAGERTWREAALLCTGSFSPDPRRRTTAAAGLTKVRAALCSSVACELCLCSGLILGGLCRSIGVGGGVWVCTMLCCRGCPVLSHTRRGCLSFLSQEKKPPAESHRTFFSLSPGVVRAHPGLCR